MEIGLDRAGFAEFFFHGREQLGDWRGAGVREVQRAVDGNCSEGLLSFDATERTWFAAINNVRGWWSGEIEGSTEKLGDEFTYRYKDVHYSKQRLVEVVPARKVVWLILDAWLSFTENRSEWNGTKVIFEVSKSADKTEVRLTHEGLVPEYECFDKCSNAWGFYVNGSLRSLITTGKGNPNQKEHSTAGQQ